LTYGRDIDNNNNHRARLMMRTSY